MKIILCWGFFCWCHLIILSNQKNQVIHFRNLELKMSKAVGEYPRMKTTSGSEEEKTRIIQEKELQQT